MNVKEIKELLELMAEHGVAEIEIEKDNMKIKLRKLPNGKVMIDQAHAMPAMMPAIVSSRRLPAAKALSCRIRYS